MVLFNSTSKGQTVLTMQPNSASGKDATISNRPNESTVNYGTNEEFIAESQPINFVRYAKRGLIQFDLSSIPSNTTVISAYRTFYAYNLSGLGGHLMAFHSIN